MLCCGTKEYFTQNLSGKKLKKRIKSKEIIRKAMSSMNNGKSGKCGLEPEIIEK